jgi:hypothetical protein
MYGRLYFMSEKATKPRGRKRKADREKVQPLNLKLAPALLSRLDEIRAGRKWPATLQDMATRYDLAEGKTSVPNR